MAEQKYPESESDYAREGTLAHAYCAKKLKAAMLRPTDEEEAEIAELNDRYWAPDMEEHTDGYAAYVLGKLREATQTAATRGHMRPELLIEQRLDYSEYVPGGFGTGDAVIVGNGVVEVIDFKYGKGVPVSAEDNPQMKLYALGALDLLDYAYELDRVVMTIYQPRIGNLSTWQTSVSELRRWAEEELRPLAKLASKGKGVRHSGGWCRFCRAKGDCPTLAAESMDLWMLNREAEGIGDSDLPEILERLDTIVDWVTAVREEALRRALAGKTLAGWKIVEGRSVRKIADEDEAAGRLRIAGYVPEEIYRPQQLRTLTELEKMVGKKRFASMMEGLIEKPKGKPTLAPESDKRKGLDPAADFAGLE